MNGWIVFGVLAAYVLLVAAGGKKDPEIDGLEDDPISAEDIRKGVQNGWYTCTLIIVDGIPAVRLYGKTVDGEPYYGLYRVSEEDWNSLKNEGYKELSNEQI